MRRRSTAWLRAVAVAAAISLLTPVSVAGVQDRSPRVLRVAVPAGDIAASVAFYRHLLGVEGERVSPGRHYFRCGKVILAVVDPQADGDDRAARPKDDHVYLAVDDVEVFHRRAQELQALLPGTGSIDRRSWGERSFYLADPFGNQLAFVDASTAFLGHEASPASARAELFQVILEVHDMARQVAFYRDILGLRVSAPSDGSGLSDAAFVRLSTPGASLALHRETRPRRRQAPVRLSFLLPDIVGRRKELLERGVVMGPFRSPAPGVLLTDGRDPEENIFHLETRVDAEGREEAAEEARGALEAWVREYNAGEWKRFLGYYAEDPRFHLHERGRVLYSSREQVAAALEELYRNLAAAVLTVGEPEAVGVSRRLALLRAPFTQRLTLADGEQLTFGGVMNVLMQRADGGWRVLAGDTVTAPGSGEGSDAAGQGARRGH